MNALEEAQKLQREIDELKELQSRSKLIIEQQGDRLNKMGFSRIEATTDILEANKKREAKLRKEIERDLNEYIRKRQTASGWPASPA